MTSETWLRLSLNLKMYFNWFLATLLMFWFTVFSIWVWSSLYMREWQCVLIISRSSVYLLAKSANCCEWRRATLTSLAAFWNFFTAGFALPTAGLPSIFKTGCSNIEGRMTYSSFGSISVSFNYTRIYAQTCGRMVLKKKWQCHICSSDPFSRNR